MSGPGGDSAAARNHDELIDALAARKAELGLSNQFIDDVGGWAKGTCNRLLGPSREKTLGRQSLDILAEILSVSFVVVPDPEKLARMERRYEERQEWRIHFPTHRVSVDMIKRAKPVIFRALASLGGRARARSLPSRHLTIIGKMGAKARWKAHRKKRTKNGEARSA